MDSNTKSLLKNTILGLASGGAISALYAMNDMKDKKSDDEFGEDEIVVPLSRRNFMQAVRSKKDITESKKQLESIPSEKDLESMSKKDIDSLKRSLLRKGAESCIKEVKSTEKSEKPVGRISGINSTFSRDKKGRFVSEDGSKATTKKAGISEDSVGVIGDAIGYVGGTTVGLTAVKLLSDRIRINRKKKQVEDARRRYTDALNREVNDIDTPYYSKSASDRGLTGTTLGLLGLTGIATGTIAGAVMYRVMENRRLEAEKAKDKDMAKYPSEKVIKFKFPKEAESKTSFFR